MLGGGGGKNKCNTIGKDLTNYDIELGLGVGGLTCIIVRAKFHRENHKKR